MILDVIIIVLLIISLFVGYKLGAARVILSLLGYVFALFVATFLGEYLSSVLYDSFVSPSVIDVVTQALNAEVYDINSAVSELPLIARFSLFVTGYDLNSAITGDGGVTTSLAIAIESALKPVVQAVLSAVLIFILFFAVYFIYRLTIYKLLIKIFRLPLLRFFNSLFGAVGGVLILTLFVSLFALILRIVSPFVEHMPFILSTSTIYNSYIFYHFYSGNIFYKLISIL
ncbi:MAG: CvpA family protein [Ruminococcus sp.]|nr:CvpA family protein [Ruminococcus sp.]